MDLRPAIGLLGVVLLIGCEPAAAPPVPSEARLHEVAEAGAKVMPFDLERTTHVFRDEPWGGELRVVSDGAEAEQVALIRRHLGDESAHFARGDFASPERIHGHDMPGLAVLRERASAIAVQYAELEDGATITFRSEDPAVVAALHTWFAAQRSDHGRHAAH
jgi:hypothetical protein